MGFQIEITRAATDSSESFILGEHSRARPERAFRLERPRDRAGAGAWFQCSPMCGRVRVLALAAPLFHRPRYKKIDRETEAELGRGEQSARMKVGTSLDFNFLFLNAMI